MVKSKRFDYGTNPAKIKKIPDLWHILWHTPKNMLINQDMVETSGVNSPLFLCFNLRYSPFYALFRPISRKLKFDFMAHLWHNGDTK